MRVDAPALPSSWADLTAAEKNAESSRPLEKESKAEKEPDRSVRAEGEQQMHPSKTNLSGTYTPTSLRTTANHYANFLTVAENNLQAAHHAHRIPQALLDIWKSK